MATESVLLTVLSWAVALAATFWFDRGGPLEIVAKLAALIFFTVGLIGLLRFLYAFIFVKDDDAISDPTQRAELLAGDKVRPGLPTPQPNPINEWSRPNTREMVSQLSVTENTTQLLDNEDV